MKRIIIALLCLMMGSTAFAQTVNYVAYALSVGTPSYSGTTWSDWEPTSVPIKINWDDAIITISSDKPQYYSIYQVGDEYVDGYGASCLECKARDRSGLRCTIKFRVQRDGTSQLYVFYNDVSWVYALRR